MSLRRLWNLNVGSSNSRPPTYHSRANSEPTNIPSQVLMEDARTGRWDIDIASTFMSDSSTILEEAVYSWSAGIRGAGDISDVPPSILSERANDDRLPSLDVHPTYGRPIVLAPTPCDFITIAVYITESIQRMDQSLRTTLFIPIAHSSDKSMRLMCPRRTMLGQSHDT